MDRKLSTRIEAALGSTIVGSAVLGGGSVGSARHVVLADGRQVFVKSSAIAAEDMYPEEARALRILAEPPDAPPVPDVLAVDPQFLVLEFLPSGAVDLGGWAAFGRALAALHRATTEQHGFDADNYIGSTPQVNTWRVDGIAFFAEHRIGYQVQLARDRRLLHEAALKRAERLIERLPTLLRADQPPSLIHGDLWSGNLVARADGVLCLVDPAAHYGFREAEVAMTRLFSTLPDAFYAAYTEAWPLPDGWEERVELFNLYHLLNHANLFGGSYLRPVDEILRKYGD